MSTRMCLILAIILIRGYFVLPSYAQEQNIAESFGLYSRGVEYYHAGKLYEAKAILERAVKLDPRNDEAQGYLDLVNAELKMRAKGQMGYYERGDELKREGGLDEEAYKPEPDETYIEGITSDRPVYYNEEGDTEGVYTDNPRGYEWGYEEGYEDADSSGAVCRIPGDFIRRKVGELNNRISPARVKGEYQMAAGFTSKDVIWKDANGDYNERNFRMIEHNYPKTNTFDARVYDRLKVIFDTNEKGEGLNLHSDITVDPWSFVGKTEKFTVTGANGDQAELELKYWSGTRSTINETFYTLRNGDAFSTSEYKVSDGKMPGFTVSTVNNWTTFTVPEKDVDSTFQPFRELWLDYNKDDYKIRVFPYGLADQALTSDDPLGLSNHHTYWEASPWLYDWIQGHLNTMPTPNDFWRGQWNSDLAFFTRDSDLKRLTALRGASFHGEDLFDNTDLSLTVATPKTLWQDYESVTALLGAMRAKTQLTDNLMLGFTDTVRFGYVDDNKVDSTNYVFGVDVSYDFNPTTNISGEFATSKSENDKTSSYETEKNGSAGHLAIRKETNLGNVKLAFTHMDKAFDPGLANYTQTRTDMFWGRHIYFKDIEYPELEPFRIGDGVDIGRNALNFRLDTKDALNEQMDNLIDYRWVRDSDHKYVEGVFREENTYRFNPEWTSKLLLIYHDLPKTKGGIDPIRYDTDTGEFLLNNQIEDGKDPSMSTASFGLQYRPEEWISIHGIYENTNDHTFATNNHPRFLLNSFNFATSRLEELYYRDKAPFLYSQGWFDMPPFERFNIYRAGISLKPSEYLGIDFDYTKNDFKFAQSIDDNMNHFNAAVKYRFNCKLTGLLKYTYSKTYNLFRLNTSGDLKYQDHHNVFAELDYQVTDSARLVVQFGEGCLVPPLWSTGSPYGDFYPTLDTRHILRIYYQGVF